MFTLDSKRKAILTASILKNSKVCNDFVVTKELNCNKEIRTNIQKVQRYHFRHRHQISYGKKYFKARKRLVKNVSISLKLSCECRRLASAG